MSGNETANTLRAFQVLDLDVALHGPNIVNDQPYATADFGWLVGRWEKLCQEVKVLAISDAYDETGDTP
jgi:hypothetical protein